MPKRRPPQKSQVGQCLEACSENEDVARVFRLEKCDIPSAEINPWALAVVCAAIGCGVYLNTSTFDWTLDDFSAVVGNKDVLSNASVGDIFRHDFWGQDILLDSSHKSYRPLTTLTFKANHALQGMDPRAFHQTNIVLYAICCFLVVLVIFGRNSTSCDGRTQNSQFVSYGTVAASLWWTVHPIHTEAVASVVGRAEILSAIFCFLAVEAFRLFSSKSYSQAAFQKVSFAAFGLCILSGALCKEIGITVCVVAAAPNVCAVMRRLAYDTPPGASTPIKADALAIGSSVSAEVLLTYECGDFCPIVSNCSMYSIEYGIFNCENFELLILLCTHPYNVKHVNWKYFYFCTWGRNMSR